MKGEKPPAPTRGIRPLEGTGGDGEEGAEDVEDGGTGGGIDVADLLPRTDIRFNTLII